jgi:hypothetical protein
MVGNHLAFKKIRSCTINQQCSTLRENSYQCSFLSIVMPGHYLWDCPFHVNDITVSAPPHSKLCRFSQPAHNSLCYPLLGKLNQSYHFTLWVSAAAQCVTNIDGDKYFVRFEVFTAVTMKNGVFWVVTPCGSCKNRRFGGTWRRLHQGEKNRCTRNNTSCN